MGKTAIVASSVAIAALIGFQAAPASSQTIEDALAKAYLNNPTLLSTRAGLRSTDESVPQALANWRPSVEITGSAGAEVVESNTSTGTDRNQSRRPKDFGISVTQPLFRGGRTLAATSGAENEVRAARARLLDSEQNILLQLSLIHISEPTRPY